MNDGNTYEQPLDEKCLQYKLVKDGNLETDARCEKCVKGYVLVDNKCRENCYVDNHLTLYKEFISIEN